MLPTKTPTKSGNVLLCSLEEINRGCRREMDKELTTDFTDDHGLLPATSTGNPHPALRATLSQWEKDGNHEGVRHIRLRRVAGYGVTRRREALKVLAGHRRLRLSREC